MTNFCTLTKRIKVILLGFLLILSLVPSSTVLAKSSSTAISPGAKLVESCKKEFLGLVPWYQYLGDNLATGNETATDSKGNTHPSNFKKCDIKCFNLTSQGEKNECGNSKSDLPLVLLAVVDDLLRIAGLVTVGFLLAGAFRYVSSQGNPDDTAQAQSTIVNSLIGLAIAITAVAFVSFSGHSLGS